VLSAWPIIITYKRQCSDRGLLISPTMDSALHLCMNTTHLCAHYVLISTKINGNLTHRHTVVTTSTTSINILTLPSGGRLLRFLVTADDPNKCPVWMDSKSVTHLSVQIRHCSQLPNRCFSTKCRCNRKPLAIVVHKYLCHTDRRIVRAASVWMMTQLYC
jgi:hypothetical protein